MAETSNYIKGLAKRIVENSYHDKSTNTLFVTNPGISAQLLKSLATKNNFKIGSTKSGEYISIPLSYKSNEFEDKYVSQFDAFLDTYTYFNRNYHTLLTAYKTFDLMEENMSEVELILSTYVEEVLSAGFIEEPLSIKISNAQAQDLVEKILRKNKIYARLPMIVRNLAKYGNMGFTLSYPYLEANEGCIDDEVREIDVLRDLVITPVNPKFFKVVCDNHYNVIHYQTSIDNTYSYTNATVTVQNQTWQPWQFCFSGDTKISLLDGRELTLLEIQKEFGDGEFWVYSCREDGRIMPGRAHSLKKTRENAELVEVELDNGEKIHCTPDHKFMLRDGTYEEAQNLKPMTSLMPLYRQTVKSDKNRRGYEQHFDNAANKWLYTHYKVAQEIYGHKRDEKGRFTKSWHIHHKDFNSLNNSPDNLQWLTCAEHNKVHCDIIKDPVLDANRRKASSEALKRTWAERYDEMCKFSSIHAKERAEKRFATIGSKVTEAQRAASVRNGKLVGALQHEKKLKRLETERFYNHKVVAVRPYHREDVYDFTVDGLHNFALSAGVFVHNCHFLLPSEMTQPYGQSMLWSMRSAFDQLTTLESLLGISRASKIQRLVISIPMPQGISTIDAYQYMNEFKGNYLNSLFADAPGVKAGRKIPGAMSIFVKPAIEGFDIDHIESNIDLADTEDVEYFLDKILRNSKLPKGYLVGEDTITTAQTLESQDLKFSRTLIPLKQGLLNGLTYMIECILTHAGFDVSKIEVEVALNKPIQVSSDLIAKYADIVELITGFNGINKMTKLNQYQAMVELGIPPVIAKLVNSGTSMPLTKDTDDLKSFMVGQTVKGAGDVAAGDEDQFPAMESARKDMRVKSKHFLAENHMLTEALHDVRKQIKGTTNKRTLFESIMTSKPTPKEEE